MLEPSCSLLGMVFSYWRLLRWCSLALYYIFIIIVIYNTLKGDKTTCRLRGSSTSQAHSHRSGTMSLHPQSSWIVPEQTARVAKAALPKSNPYMHMYDEMGALYSDEMFLALFPCRGRSAESPARLALVLVMQFAENLTDRQAADAVRSRLDWKYVLGLELEDCGFNFSVLSEFRDRLLVGETEQLLLDAMLAKFQERGLLKTRGRQRTDSTHILASIR